MNRNRWFNTNAMDYDNEDHDTTQPQGPYWGNLNSSFSERESLPLEAQEAAHMSPYATPFTGPVAGAAAANVARYQQFMASPFILENLENDPIAAAQQGPDPDDERKPAAVDSEIRPPRRHSLSNDPFVGGGNRRLFHTRQEQSEDEMKDVYEAIQMPSLGHTMSPRYYPVYETTGTPAGKYPPPPPQMQYASPTYSFQFGQAPPYSAHAHAVQETGSESPHDKKQPIKKGTKTKAARKGRNRRPASRQQQTQAGERTAQYRRSPTAEEIHEAKTPRARAALNSWYERYSELVKYKQKHGDCNVPQKYSPNPPLGIWVNKVRMERKSCDDGKKSSLTSTKIKVLEDIGFKWAKRKGQPSWDARFTELVEYKSQHGDCNVPTKFADSPALGRWVSTQRSQFKQFLCGWSTQITQERIDRLNGIGFRWSMMEREEDGLQEESSGGDS